MLRELYRCIFMMRLKIRLMSDHEFNDLLKSCDNQQAIYALYFRYYQSKENKIEKL